MYVCLTQTWDLLSTRTATVTTTDVPDLHPDVASTVTASTDVTAMVAVKESLAKRVGIPVRLLVVDTLALLPEADDTTSFTHGVIN